MVPSISFPELRSAIQGREPPLVIDVRKRAAFREAAEMIAGALRRDPEAVASWASDTVGDDPDVSAFDDALRLLYVASESGVVSVFRLEGTKLKKVGQKLLADRAHSVAVDPQTHRVYFPIESVNGHPVLRIMELVGEIAKKQVGK